VIQRQLTEAVGYLELGMLQDAWDALEEIPAEQRHLPPVLQIRLEIYRRMEKYEGMATIAEHLTKFFEKTPRTGSVSPTPRDATWIYGLRRRHS
jgi:hypothetical protein